MKRLRSRAFSIGCIATLLPVLTILSMPQQVLADSGENGRNLVLYSIAADTWKFYAEDIDPNTNLPMDNLTWASGGPLSGKGQYTSASNIGVYLWAVVAANDLHLISRAKANSLISATLTAVAKLDRYQGMLYQWYDTTNGHKIRNPGDIDCADDPLPHTDNCDFLSAVDNGWYASGLIVVRQALPELRRQVDSLLRPMNFGLFYDDGYQHPGCNVNTGTDPNPNQPTGQMFGGFFANQGPAGYHNGALYSDPRIAIYIGMGRRQMPGDVWWRSWRVLPPKQCPTDPDFSWIGQWPAQGYWQTYTDPQSGKMFNVWEGHYVDQETSRTFVPTWAGGMFEGLMANLVMPETTFGPRSFGLNNRRWAQVQVDYTTRVLGYPVWGMSPSSTPDDTGGYAGYGVEGLLYPYFGGGADASHPSLGLSQCHGCATEDTVSPHASFLALSVLPHAAYDNIVNLRTLYPDVYSSDGGFYDAVNPMTGAVGHRRLVLDQSMIMAAIDNEINHGALQRHFASDPIARIGLLYLAYEKMSIH